MDLTFNTFLFFSVFITLLVIMDPFGTVPIFAGLVNKYPATKQKQLAFQAVALAFLVIVAFALFGEQVLAFLGISLPSIQASGGLLLLLVALELLTGKNEKPQGDDDINVALVPLGTPLLAGPGAIAATIVFVNQANTLSDFFTIGVAIFSVHLIVFLSLRFSIPIIKLLGAGGISVATKLAGLLLAAIAVQLIVDAIYEFLKIYAGQ
jgi:multiple antibiotic resistance protein